MTSHDGSKGKRAKKRTKAPAAPEPSTRVIPEPVPNLTPAELPQGGAVARDTLPSKRRYPPLVKLMSLQIRSFNVSHDRYCEPLGECHCHTGTFGRARRSRATGIRGLARRDKTFPPTLTFAAFVPQDVPDSLLEEPEIAAAIKIKALRQVQR